MCRNGYAVDSIGVTVRVVAALVIPSEYVTDYISSVEYAVEHAVAYFKDQLSDTTDDDRVAVVYSIIKRLSAVDVNSLICYQDDGSAFVKTPLPFMEVSIEGDKYVTDANGEIVTQRDYGDKADVVVAKLGVVIDHGQYSSASKDETGKVDLEIIRSLDEFGLGVERMGKAMEVTGSGLVFPTWYLEIGDVFGIVSPGNRASSTVVKDIHIVGCNKHDKGYVVSTAAQFALGSSDCSMSTKLGMLYASDPYGLSAFSYSFYCYLEAMGDLANTHGNVYCTGTATMDNGTSKGSHMNCSWFTGIAHNEAAHWHN